MAKKKSLMDALNEYQESNPFGKAQRKEEREKKMGERAAKAKVDTKRAFSTKPLLKTDKVEPVKKKDDKKDPPAARRTPPPTQRRTPPPANTNKDKDKGKDKGKDKTDNKGSDRASKFLGGQTIKELQEWTKKEKARRERSDFLGQARKRQAEEMKRWEEAKKKADAKRRAEAEKRGGSKWTSSQLAESRRKLGGK